MNRKSLTKSLVRFLCLLLICTFSIPVYAAKPDNEYLSKKEIVNKAEEFINSSNLVKAKFKEVEVKNSLTEVYDANENLIAYSVDLVLDGQLGYILVGATKDIPVIEIGSCSFIEKESKSKFNDKITKLKQVNNKKFIFGGPLTYIIKLEYDDNTNQYFDINTEKEITNIEEFAPLSNSYEQENAAQALAYTYDYHVLDYSLPYVNQMDFPTSNMQAKGCGPASGAILTWYVGENHSNYGTLLNGSSTAQELGEVMFSYMGSGIYGTLPADYQSGIYNYFMSKGYPSPSVIRKERSSGYSTLWSYIKSGIKTVNTPVALYMGAELSGSGEEPGPGAPALHWVSIDGYEDYDINENYITFESWGDFYADNFYAIWNWRNGIAVEYINITIP